MKIEEDTILRDGRKEVLDRQNRQDKSRYFVFFFLCLGRVCDTTSAYDHSWSIELSSCRVKAEGDTGE
jgi:hypothetical protein